MLRRKAFLVSTGVTLRSCAGGKDRWSHHIRVERHHAGALRLEQSKSCVIDILTFAVAYIYSVRVTVTESEVVLILPVAPACHE